MIGMGIMEICDRSMLHHRICTRLPDDSWVSLHKTPDVLCLWMCPRLWAQQCPSLVSVELCLCLQPCRVTVGCAWSMALNISRQQ